MNKELLIQTCHELIAAFENGELGQTEMPENANPFTPGMKSGLFYAYFSLPMALNYQRNSYDLWKFALATFNDPNTRDVFDVKAVTKMSTDELRKKMLKYKVALQPNKHVETWRKISETVWTNWGCFESLIAYVDNDYLRLKQLMQNDFKRGFPYLSGPKIFNYWCYILTQYCNVEMKNAEYIEIAPDTHITKCSVKLGVINEEEAETLSKDQISERWRLLLAGSGINPIDMHAPLWFWSRNGFIYNLKTTR